MHTLLILGSSCLIIAVNGGWSAFGVYGKCSKKCDGGVKKRKRFCNNPTPRYGGNGCKGSSEQSVQCNTHKCPGMSSNCFANRI